ncbi:transketolase [Candidatus Margulisiibacteriota bacterium]
MQQEKTDKEQHAISLEKLEEIAKQLRKEVLIKSHAVKTGHIGSAFSIIELLVFLYYKQLNISNSNKYLPERDRFILSKGHACCPLYITLCKRGLISQEVLDKYSIDGGLLEHHPRRELNYGIEVSTGSLGHGLSIGCGLALAAKKDKRKNRVYVLLSDGELNEGTIWEAVMFANQKALNNLVAIVDFNKIQAMGSNKEVMDLEPLEDKWKAFGWNVFRIDGHSFSEIDKVFSSLNKENIKKPSVIIADTIKGKGVSFMEHNLLWHYRCPDAKELELALAELEGKS